MSHNAHELIELLTTMRADVLAVDVRGASPDLAELATSTLKYVATNTIDTLRSTLLSLVDERLESAKLREQMGLLEAALMRAGKAVHLGQIIDVDDIDRISADGP